jgi:hypothetical protein
LLAIAKAPNRRLYRTRHGYAPAGAVVGAAAFTYRLMRMMEVAYLISFDDPAFPSYVTLTKPGQALAEQLLAAEVVKGGGVRAARRRIGVMVMSLVAAASVAACMPSSPPADPRPMVSPGTWVLEACIGVSWGGCGRERHFLFPTEDSCYRALSAMQTGDQPVAESDKKRNTVAVCRPHKPGERVQR